MACDCVDRMNEAMAARNAAIEIGMLIDYATGKLREAPPAIKVYKVDPKRRDRLPTLLATFCPFCGRKYEPE